MYSYLKIGKCRICEHPDDTVVSNIDKDLLNDVPMEEVYAKYAGHFKTRGKFLNSNSIFSHRSHLRRAVPSALLEIPDLSVAGTNTSLEKTNPERSKGFDSFLGTAAKNREMLDTLVSSAIEDLNSSDEFLELAVGPKNKALILSVRDKIRESLAGYIELSKSLASPEIAINIKGQEGDRVVELLVMVKQAFDNVVSDDSLKERFFNELATLIRRSVTLKDIFDREKANGRVAS
jgi:hypothetical protein